MLFNDCVGTSRTHQKDAGNAPPEAPTTRSRRSPDFHSLAHANEPMPNSPSTLSLLESATGPASARNGENVSSKDPTAAVATGDKCAAPMVSEGPLAGLSLAPFIPTSTASRAHPGSRSSPSDAKIPSIALPPSGTSPGARVDIEPHTSQCSEEARNRRSASLSPPSSPEPVLTTSGASGAKPVTCSFTACTQPLSSLDSRIKSLNVTSDKQTLGDGAVAKAPVTSEINRRKLPSTHDSHIAPLRKASSAQPSDPSKQKSSSSHDNRNVPVSTSSVSSKSSMPQAGGPDEQKLASSHDQAKILPTSVPSTSNKGSATETSTPNLQKSTFSHEPPIVVPTSIPCISNKGSVTQSSTASILKSTSSHDPRIVPLSVSSISSKSSTAQPTGPSTLNPTSSPVPPIVPLSVSSLSNPGSCEQTDIVSKQKLVSSHEPPILVPLSIPSISTKGSAAQPNVPSTPKSTSSHDSRIVPLSVPFISSHGSCAQTGGLASTQSSSSSHDPRIVPLSVSSISSQGPCSQASGRSTPPSTGSSSHDPRIVPLSVSCLSTHSSVAPLHTKFANDSASLPSTTLSVGSYSSVASLQTKSAHDSASLHSTTLSGGSLSRSSVPHLQTNSAHDSAPITSTTLSVGALSSLSFGAPSQPQSSLSSSITPLGSSCAPSFGGTSLVPSTHSSSSSRDNRVVPLGLSLTIPILTGSSPSVGPSLQFGSTPNSAGLSSSDPGVIHPSKPLSPVSFMNDDANVPAPYQERSLASGESLTIDDFIADTLPHSVSLKPIQKRAPPARKSLRRERTKGKRVQVACVSCHFAKTGCSGSALICV